MYDAPFVQGPMTETPDPRLLDGTPLRPIKRIGWGISTDVLSCLTQSGVEVAVKVLRPSASDDDESRVRLFREAEALQRVSHPSIIELYAWGTTRDGRPYLVMPLLDGVSLRERLRRAGTLGPGHAIRVLTEVLEGLSAAHNEGFVHRDVKPANIMLARCGRAGTRRSILIDFSVTYPVEDDASLSTANHLIGTPRYLAPEQIMGGAIDARTDLYSAGLTLFETIAGRSPFAVRGAMELLRAQLETKPHRLAAVADVSPELDAVVSQALQKRPDLRFSSADEFIRALKSVPEAHLATTRKLAPAPTLRSGALATGALT